MLDIRKAGAYISKLRKERDMTQIQLADQLNVSHQAVSKWERGESLPDIGTIPVIAKMFGTTVDAIIHGGEEENAHTGYIIEQIADNKPDQVAEMVNIGQIQLSELADVAELVKPSILQKVTEKVDKARFSMDIILQLAPFLETEDLDTFVLQVSDQDQEIQASIISGLAPFLSRNGLNQLVDKSIEGTLDMGIILELAPFLGREQIDRLVERAEAGAVSWETVQSLAPFLSRENMEKLVGNMDAEHFNPEILASLAPFLGKDTLSRIVSSLVNNLK